MKAINKVLSILVIVFGLASVVLFFTKFATIVTVNDSFSGVGAQFAFGSKIKGVEMARSAHLLFCFWLSVIGVALSFFALKSKKVRYFVPAVAFVDAIYMFVLRFLKNPIDVRPLTDVTKIVYEPSFLIAAIVLLAMAVLALTYLLLDDYLEVLASKGDKLTIGKRVVRFFRDYKSETKKIVWPTFKDVLKNTIIVLVMCLLVGALIWLVDFGLGQLLDLILGIVK